MHGRRDEAAATGASQGLPPDSVFLPAEFLTGVARLLNRDLLGAASALADAQRHARALDVPIIEADAMSVLGMLTLMTGDVSAGAGLIVQSAEASTRTTWTGWPRRPTR